VLVEGGDSLAKGNALGHEPSVLDKPLYHAPILGNVAFIIKAVASTSARKVIEFTTLDHRLDAVTCNEFECAKHLTDRFSRLVSKRNTDS